MRKDLTFTGRSWNRRMRARMRAAAAVFIVTAAGVSLIGQKPSATLDAYQIRSLMYLMVPNVFVEISAEFLAIHLSSTLFWGEGGYSAIPARSRAPATCSLPG